MKKVISLFLLLSCMAAFVLPTQATSKKKKKNEETVEKKEPVKPKSKYEKLFSDRSHVKAVGDFLTIHQVKGKVYFEMPLKYFGRDLLLASTVKESSNPDLAIVGFKAKDPEHLKFVLRDSLVLKVSPANKEYDADLENVVKLQHKDPYMSKFKIEAYSQDSSAVVFEATKLLKSNVGAIMTQLGSMVFISASEDSELTKIGEAKVFEDNATIELDMTFKCSREMIISRTSLGNVSVKVLRTLLLLPEDVMMPHLSDGRIGIFPTMKSKFSNENDDILNVRSYANRWRLDPKDVAAWKRGELVEPVKPIVYYLDTLFPEFWKAPIREGVLRWNKAFEVIGLKNAVQIRDYPKNDPSFDPDNMKYSCIRYVLTGTANAMGPSWVDPRSGEIINASVIVYSNLTKLINNWRFVQTAQVDPRVRARKMPADVMYESIAYAIAHEIGHTLGMMHNMSASASYDVDSLRSVSFTQKYGTTPSIMDYARYNYVAQPTDKDVRLSPPDLGVYDYYTIKWLYTPVPDAKTPEEANRELEKMIDEKAGDPLYRYGVQQVYYRYDPSALEEDLGNDPIKAGEYGIANLKYIMKHMNEWISDDPDGSYRFMLFGEISNQYYRYLMNVLYNVGGIYCTKVKDGTKGESYQPVDRKIQKESFAWVFKQLKNSEWLDDKNLRNKFPLAPSFATMFVKNMVKQIIGTYGRVALSSCLADVPYRMSEFYDDLYKLAFDGTIKGKALTATERTLQRELVSAIAVTKSAPMAIPIGLHMEKLSPLAPTVEEIVAYGLDRSGMIARNMDVCRKIESEYGCGVFAIVPEAVNLFPGYNFQKEINIESIDESNGCKALLAQKVQSLLKVKVATANDTDKAHYTGMLTAINKSLKN